jgi:hypothetical protein
MPSGSDNGNGDVFRFRFLFLLRSFPSRRRPFVPALPKERALSQSSILLYLQQPLALRVPLRQCCQPLRQELCRPLPVCDGAVCAFPRAFFALPSRATSIPRLGRPLHSILRTLECNYVVIQSTRGGSPGVRQEQRHRGTQDGKSHWKQTSPNVQSNLSCILQRQDCPASVPG